ncbi:MAG: DNA replication/repair protein RecF [Rhodovarius sp.]|nr:DNA replication/repair protein RecF [Rhodovarius sp.]MCX7931248.1 DNA replication/repair protein RecF [Rhodovarius sp.]MDW8315090.1 DNA replication/repair protein RecF [Rhodovarius sp.]
MTAAAPSLRLIRLSLHRFRSYTAARIDVGAALVVVTGPNGAGKTNLLEAISLLCPGRGLRGARMAELAQGGSGPWAVAGRFDGAWGRFEVGTGSAPDAQGDRRLFRLDGEPLRSQAELAERVAAVWLTPQMERLFQEGASGRRRFLDRLAWALEPAHAREVAAYEHAMAQRNRLLASGGDPAWLAALEDAMARHGVAAAAARRALVARLDARLAAGSMGGFPAAGLALCCPTAAALAEGPALAAEEALRRSLHEGRARDRAAAAALAGPHRCDLVITHREKGLPAALCSTGEQKALLISILLAHAGLIAEARGFAPLLLLDEVMAHLDAARREALFGALAALPAQAWLTGAEEAAFAPLRGLAQAFTVAEGQIRENARWPLP